MRTRHGRPHSGLQRALAWASLGLGIPQVALPDLVARITGVDDSDRAVPVIRAVGLREVGHSIGLFLGPRWVVWTRVAGDAMDITALAVAVAARSGERRRRTSVATAMVLGITAVDLYAGLRKGRDEQHGKGRPGPLKLTASTTVNRSPEDVYAYWRDFENLPTFMRHLKSVTTGADGRSHWEVNAPLRRSVQWDAELTGDEPGRRISWLSLPGADIDNAGTVHFAPAPDGRGTEVHVILHYDVPGGVAGKVAAKLFGEEPEQQVRDDLRRFKQVLETGEVVRTEALPEGTAAGHQLVQRPAKPRKRGRGGKGGDGR